MASEVERNARLDHLIREADAWAEKRLKYLEDQATRGKSILRGRTGAERLNNASVSSATLLLTDEIDKFLSG